MFHASDATNQYQFYEQAYKDTLQVWKEHEGIRVAYSMEKLIQRSVLTIMINTPCAPVSITKWVHPY